MQTLILMALVTLLIVINTLLYMAFQHYQRPGRRPMSSSLLGPLEPGTPLPSSPRAPAALFCGQGVTKFYATPHGPILVLDHLNLAIGEGITMILGPSGQGKTTLLNCLGGLLAPDEGEIFFKGQTIPYGNETGLRHYRGHRVAWVFQDLNLISHLTALENAAMPLLIQGRPRAQALHEAGTYLEALGIGSCGRRRPNKLSGGQRQRVAIARAFASPAEVILADEPTGSLDAETRQDVMKALRALSRRAERPIVMVTHNEELAGRYADRIFKLAGSQLTDVTAAIRRQVQRASHPGDPVSEPSLAIVRRRDLENLVLDKVQEGHCHG